MTGRAATRIGRYRVEGVVGTGAFATVYRGVDERLDDTVALKVLAENHSLDPDDRERFLTEGRVLRRIESHHVVRAYDLGETDRQQPYLVLEYADGGTLASRVAQLRRGPWRPGPDDVLALAVPLARAVDAVHRADVVHRDLSPGNVLVTSSRPSADPASEHRSPLVGDGGRLLLADLGLCKDLARNSGHTAAGGTDGFRPPEQRGGPAVVDGAADLWSLSALVVWLVTGAPPDGDPGDLGGVVAAAGLPAGLGTALAVSLRDDPRARHRSATAWLDDVRSALAPPPPPAASAAGRGAGPGAMRRGASRRPNPGESGTFHGAAPDGDRELAAGGEAGQPPAGSRPRPSSGRSGRSRAAGAGPPPWRPGRRAGLLAAVVVVGSVVAAFAFVLLRGGSNGPEVTRGDDGTVRVARTEDDATVAFAGPAETAVGEPAIFTADLTGVDEWAWVGPDGVLHDGTPRLRVDPTSSGIATVTLIGVLPSGEPVLVAHDLRVTER